MYFQLTIFHNATDEPGINAWIIYIKDNHPTTISQAGVDTRSMECTASFVFSVYQDIVDTITAFKTQFTVDYNLRVST